MHSMWSLATICILLEHERQLQEVFICGIFVRHVIPRGMDHFNVGMKQKNNINSFIFSMCFVL